MFGSKISDFVTEMPEPDDIPLIRKYVIKTNQMDNPEDIEILYAARQSDIKNLPGLIDRISGSARKAFEPSNDTLLHRIAEGGCTDSVQAANIILQNPIRSDINAVNVKGDTALHNAVIHYDRLDLVNLFLSKGADVEIANKKGENALHLAVQYDTDGAIEIAKTLLSRNDKLLSSKTKSNVGEGLTVFHIAAKHSAVQMLEFLWEECKRDVSLVSENNKEYGTPLHLAVQNGDNVRAVKTVEFLLSIMTKESVNELRPSDGNSALHITAKECSLNLLTALVRHIKVIVFKLNDNKESCLDMLAGVSDQNPNSVLCAEVLLRESHQLAVGVKAEKCRLIFKSIPVAVSKKSTNMAQLLVTEHGNSNNAICKSKNSLLESIYEKTPIAAIPMLNKAVTYKATNEEDDFLETINVDMGAVTGFKRAPGGGINESEALFGIFKTNKKQQRKILEHPVIQIFLKEKWRTLSPFMFVYIFLYIPWLLAYSALTYELYPPECPNPDAVKNGVDVISKENSGLPRIFLSVGFQNTTQLHQCEFNAKTARLLAFLLYVYMIFFVAQESIKFILSKSWRHYLSVITAFQIIRHIGVTINITSAFMDPTDIPEFQFHLGMILFCLSWLLFLNELAFIPSLALLLSIIIKTVLKYGKYILIFIPILIAFVPMLSRYVVESRQFTFLLFGVIKNFILMTGEVDYKETFYRDDWPKLESQDIAGQFILVIAVFGFGLVLANVLTGVAVKNFQDLYKDAEYETSAMQLKSIYFVDSLIVWLQQFPITYKLSELFEFIHLKYAGESRKVKGVKTCGYSDELKQRIQEIATREDGVLKSPSQ